MERTTHGRTATADHVHTHLLLASMDAKELTGPILERGAQFVLMHSIRADPLPVARVWPAWSSSSIKLWERATQLGAYWQEHLHRLAMRYKLIGDVRDRGLIQGIKLVWDRVRRTPAFEAGPQIAQTFPGAGPTVQRRGSSVLRFVPPLAPLRASSITRQRSLSEPFSG